jgi:NTP pyrophosphatase (non-canonical NTP hydrolase)
MQLHDKTDSNIATPSTVEELEKWVRDRYGEVDRARGLDRTFLLFIEEVGELSTAVARRDLPNIREEVGDVLMWLVSLSNLAGVNLQESVEDYVERNKGTIPKE